MTRIGWCPGGRPVADMLKLYPGTRVVRIFVGPNDPLPAWDGPILGPLVALGVVVHLSFKTYDAAAVRRLVDGKPAGLLLILTFGHEPEQGTRAGDLPIDQWRARWADLVTLLADHPARDEVLLAPVYTRYWWQKFAGDLRWLLDLPVDAIAWDVYNDGATYRTPDDLLSIPRAIAARTGLPYLIAELGAVRLAVDVDGSGRTAWMRALATAAALDGALTACWFHRDEWDLTRPDSIPEQQTWRELTQEANVDPYLAPSLRVLRAEIDARWPRRDKTSDGWIGDAAHQASQSDHNPNIRGSVDAIDVDNDGIDPYVVTDAFQRHPSAHYWIYQRQIADKDDGWQRRPYDGPSPHTEHVHFSIRQSATAEQDTRPWGLLEDDMPLTNADEPVIQHAVHGTQIGRTGVTVGQAFATLLALPTAVAALRAEVAAATGRDLVDEQAIVAGVLAGLSPKAIAAAIPPELAKQVADELAARLTS